MTDHHSILGIMAGAGGYSFVTRKASVYVTEYVPTWLPQFVGDWAQAGTAAVMAVAGWFIGNKIPGGLGEGVKLCSLGWGIGAGIGVGKAMGLISQTGALGMGANNEVDYRGAGYLVERQFSNNWEGRRV